VAEGGDPVQSAVNRAGFDCGVPALNEYLQRYARQNHESGGAKAFVAVAPETPAIVLGYYTISPGAIAFAKAPARLTRRLGRYERAAAWYQRFGALRLLDDPLKLVLPHASFLG